MFVSEVTLSSIFHKITKKITVGQTLYVTVSLHIYGGGNRYMKKPGRF